MKITLNIPDGTICAFLNGVECKDGGLNLVSYQLCSDDLKDGNTITLPRKEKENE